MHKRDQRAREKIKEFSHDAAAERAISPILNTNSSGLERQDIGADESADFGHEGRQSASGGPVLDLVGHVLHLLGERGQVL